MNRTSFARNANKKKNGERKVATNKNIELKDSATPIVLTF